MKTDRVFLQHIIDSISSIEEFLRDVSNEEFRENRMLYNAVIRELEIIGEAGKNVSEEMKDKYPDIPWKKITGMRNKLIHDYFGVDLKVVWDTALYEIPKLKEQIKDLISREYK